MRIIKKILLGIALLIGLALIALIVIIIVVPDPPQPKSDDDASMKAAIKYTKQNSIKVLKTKDIHMKRCMIKNVHIKPSVFYRIFPKRRFHNYDYFLIAADVSYLTNLRFSEKYQTLKQIMKKYFFDQLDDFFSYDNDVLPYQPLNMIEYCYDNLYCASHMTGFIDSHTKIFYWHKPYAKRAYGIGRISKYAIKLLFEKIEIHPLCDAGVCVGTRKGYVKEDVKGFNKIFN